MRGLDSAACHRHGNRVVSSQSKRGPSSRSALSCSYGALGRVVEGSKDSMPRRAASALYDRRQRREHRVLVRRKPGTNAHGATPFDVGASNARNCRRAGSSRRSLACLAQCRVDGVEFGLQPRNHPKSLRPFGVCARIADLGFESTPLGQEAALFECVRWNPIAHWVALKAKRPRKGAAVVARANGKALQVNSR